MRRRLVFIAAGILILAFAAPVAAAPGRNTMPYLISCADGTEFAVDARGVPGWDQDWQPGSTPRLLLTYQVNWLDPTTPGDDFFVDPPPPGLAKHAHLYGPCEIIGDGWDPGWWITEAWFLDT